MEVRATGMALGFSGKTALTIMLVQVTPIAMAAITWRYFMIFIFMDAIFLVGFYFFFPEVWHLTRSNVLPLTCHRPQTSRLKKLPPFLATG